MSFFIVPDQTRASLNQLNRYRRNKRRKLVRRWHGNLRRADESAERKAHALFVESCAKECVCEPPHPCPCDSVLCGMWCEQRGVGFDEEDEAKP